MIIFENYCFQKHANLDKLEAHPLLVSLNGGRLDSEVCASPDDDYTSLNIKRAVASLFQANTNEDGGSSNEVKKSLIIHTTSSN